jgi:hypothetical protein
MTALLKRSRSRMHTSLVSLIELDGASLVMRSAVQNPVISSQLRRIKPFVTVYRHFRVELVGEPAEAVPELLQRYKSVLQGKQQWQGAQQL